ncbi:OmpH family outer membrane protein [Luteitalea pratensis]|uniref:OmpH family outer membrane protein n=1 Tax=Luteitalea pratensis TaxID=1855912 RepID=UPI00138FB0F0|nr:OmpH family outer membrane protein [Luteitalea pratensis]
MNGRSYAWALAILVGLVPAARAQVRPDPGAPAAAVARLFPADARIGLVDFTRVAAVSTSGKAMSARIEALRSRKEAEVNARSKDVAALESKLQSAAVLNAAAREQLRRQFERAQVDFQRFTQDAQSEVQQVQREVEQAFLEKARPAVAEVAKERSLWAVLSMGDSGLVWWEPALDLSDEIAKRIDASPAP